METSSHDILLIGGGGAGLRAAIAIAEANPKLRCRDGFQGLPDAQPYGFRRGRRRRCRRTTTIPSTNIATTRFRAATGWAIRTRSKPSSTRFPKELLQLEHWGCPWSREPDGRIAVRPFGGMKKMRTWFAADKTGFHMLHTLFQTSLKYDSITRYDESFATRLLVEDGAVQGVVAIELRTGKVRAITAKAVIICTGGCGRVFPFTTNANICTGDGMALAYRAGAPLKDMEMVQYHPTGLPFTGILITEAARAEGGWLLNKDNYRFLQDYDLGKPTPTPVFRSMELGPRDRVSQAIFGEFEKGRAFHGPYGDYVHLDLRHLGRTQDRVAAADGARALPQIREYRSGARADSGTPGAALHDGRRSHRYPCGDAARRTCSRRARPPASASMARIGWVRTRWARCWCSAHAPAVQPPSTSPTVPTPANTNAPPGAGRRRRAPPRRGFLHKTGGTERIAKMRDEMQQTMESGCGIYRERNSLVDIRQQDARAAGTLPEYRDR